jgi:hypothetical protein
MFSTLKYVNAPNFEKFRQVWNAKYLGGFVVHSKVFEGLKGDFPIGFLVWATEQNAKKKQPIVEIATEVFDKRMQAIGEKYFFNLPNSQMLTNWIGRQKPNEIEALPLINTVTPTTKTKGVRRTQWSDGAIGHMLSDSNDLQNSGQATALFSSVHSIGHKGGFFVTAENLWQASVIFSVRRLVKPTWLNDRDQFLQPTQPLSDEFKSDCLLWMLFNGSNLTAGANDLVWNDKKWSLVNHFIPYTEAEVGAPDRFESDFMVQYLAELPTLKTPSPQPSPASGRGGKNEAGKQSDASLPSPVYGRGIEGEGLSDEALAVLDAGRTLWQAYFAHTDVRTVRDELKLNRPDVGWYQIRNALKKRNESGDTTPVDFTPFETAYKTLTEKLQPQVFELGFLR